MWVCSNGILLDSNHDRWITTLFVPLDCCSSITLTLGNSIKNINNYQDLEGIYTFSGVINGMDYFVHSAKQVAIWYVVCECGTHYWIIGAMSNLGTFGPAKMYTSSKELKNKCPMNNGYVWSWRYSDNGFQETNEIYVKCESEDDFCTSENPCAEDQGDCDTHDECQDGLRCGTNNCPITASMSTDMDCCSVHDGCMYNSN